MNTTFNTIETIRTNNSIINKSASYLEACNQFEIQSTQFVNNENYVSRKSAEEVSLAFHKLKSATCEYTTYIAANHCEKWLEKAWNNAD